MGSLLRPTFRRFFSTKFYTESHEWISLDKNTMVATIGISDFAQNELGDLVHLETVDENTHFTKGDSFCTLESVKGVSDAYVPIEAEGIETNEKVLEDPSIINDDAENTWSFKVTVKNADDVEALMN